VNFVTGTYLEAARREIAKGAERLARQEVLIGRLMLRGMHSLVPDAIDLLFMLKAGQVQRQFRLTAVERLNSEKLSFLRN
jgi:hypothetical protein